MKKNHADTGQELKFASNISMRNSCDFRDFDCGMVVGVRLAGVSI